MRGLKAEANMIAAMGTELVGPYTMNVLKGKQYPVQLFSEA